MSVPIQLLFGAVDVSFLLQRDGNLTYDKNVNQRWTCSFNLIEPATGTVGANRPVAGQTFTLFEDGVLVFSGFIDQVTEVALPSTTQIQYQCQCSSWSTVCDHRVVTADYVAGDILFNVIQDIVTRFLAGDGITITTNVDGSAFLPSAVSLNPATVADAFDQLRNLTGRQWWIDENKDLHFTIVGNGPNTGLSLADNDGKWLNGTMSVKRTTAQYRNTQYVQTGAGLGTVSRTETFIGDGSTFFFVTKFPITAAPTVTVNGTAQTIKQLGSDPYGQNAWYWNPSGPGVQQGQAIAPASGAIIQVTYDAQTVNYAVESNAAQITARAAIEGDSGIWAQITNQNNIKDLTAAQAYANGLLSNFSFIPSVVQFETFIKGWTLGGFVTMAVTMHGLSGIFTVIEVQAKEEPSMVQNPAVPASVGGQMHYTVTLSDQPGIGNFIQWFTGLVNSLKPSTGSATSGSATGSGGTGNPQGTGGLTPVPAPAGIQFINEEPAGTKNGSNTTFTISYTPVLPFFALSLNGILQSPYAQPSPETTADYTLSGKTITMRVAPKATDEMFVQYVVGLSGGSPRSTQARQFAGGTDAVNWGTGAGFNLHSDMSLGIWVKFSASAAGTIIARGGTGATSAFNDAFGLYVAGASNAWNVTYKHFNGTQVLNSITFTTNIPNDTWKYIGFSRDATAKTVSLYVGDGLNIALIATSSYANNPDGGTDASCSLVVGNHT